MQRIADGLDLLDTRLGGHEGVTAAFLVRGPRPALVEAGARTSAATVAGALAAAGLGPQDLATIVLTHVHLDHCGATGLLAERFPRARVVVHRRGARHLVEPERLVAASAEVYGERASLYGGLDPTPAERVVAAEDGHRVDVGGGRELVLVETLGHARHHMSVLDTATGTVLAGDAVGVRFADSRLFPALPPPDIDLERAGASMLRLADLAPTGLCLAHFGPVPDPAETLARAGEQFRILSDAAMAGWRRGGDAPSVAAAVDAALPLAETVGEGPGLVHWRRLGWAAANADGLAGWAAGRDRPGRLGSG